MTFASALDYCPELLVNAGHPDPPRPDRRGAEGHRVRLGRWPRRWAGSTSARASPSSDRAVLAVEAIEGTDQAIAPRRPACRAGGFVVVKVAKPQQDMRFDVPDRRLHDHRDDAQGRRPGAGHRGRQDDPPRPAGDVALADRYGIAIVAVERPRWPRRGVTVGHSRPARPASIMHPTRQCRRTGSRPVMGTMRFLSCRRAAPSPAGDGPGPRPCVAGGYDNMPAPTHRRSRQRRAAARPRRGRERLPRRAVGGQRRRPAHGLVGHAGRAAEPVQPGRRTRPRQGQPGSRPGGRWRADGLQVADALDAQIREASRLFGRAVTNPDVTAADADALAALEMAYRAANELVRAYVDQMFRARHQRQPQLDTLSACG